MDQDLYKKDRIIYHRRMSQSSKTTYNYYDTPDGHDLIRKLWATTKMGIMAGTIYGGLISIVKVPGPTKRIMVAVDAARRAVPFILYPIVYTTTTYALTDIRKKDEVLNASIGGAVAGLVFGLWHRNGGVAAAASLVSAILCGVKKHMVEIGYDFPEKETPRMGLSSWALRNLDFTLTRDVPGKPTPKRRPPPPPPPPPPPMRTVCEGF